MAPNCAAGQKARSTCKVLASKEDPINSDTPGRIHVMHGGVLPAHAGGPVGEHLSMVGVSGDAPREVNVGPLIFTTDHGRPSHCDTRDARIGVGRRNQPLAQPFSLLGREHSARYYGSPLAHSLDLPAALRRCIGLAGAP